MCYSLLHTAGMFVRDGQTFAHMSRPQGLFRL